MFHRAFLHFGTLHSIFHHYYGAFTSSLCSMRSLLQLTMCAITVCKTLAACNTLLSLQFTLPFTPAVVFGANRTIMRSLLDLRQLRLSASCLCKSSLFHLFKICEFMKYDSINLILRQSLKLLISGFCSLNRQNPNEVASPFPDFLSAFIK